MSDETARGEAETTTRTEATAVLIGMDAPEGMDRNMWDAPTDNVEVLIVRYPMSVERRAEAGSECCEEFEPLTISSEAELREWARSEFDHYDIRVL